MNEPNDAQRPACADSAFELYFKIPPVSITHGHGTDLSDKTFTSANHLLKELHRLGKEGIPLQFVMSGSRVLERGSLRAMNCYLKYVYGCRSLNKLRAGNIHRFAWNDLQREVGLRWVKPAAG